MNGQKIDFVHYERTIQFFLIFLLLAAIFIRFSWGDNFTYSVFTDRDLWRALKLNEEFQYLGAESTYHLARTPGGFMSYYFALIQQLSTSANFIHSFVVLMDIAGLILIPLLFRRYFGLTIALLLAAFYGCSLVVLEELWKFWNPSVTPLIALFISYGMMRFLVDKKMWGLPFSCFLASIGAQFHISLVGIMLLFIFAALIIRPRTPAMVWLYALIGIIIAYSPYLFMDGLNHFENTKYFLGGPGTEKPAQMQMDVPLWLLGWLRVSGGRSFPELTSTQFFENLGLYYFAAMFVFNIALFALVITISFQILHFFNRKSVTANNRFGRLEWALVGITVVGAIIAAQNANNVQGRYHIGYVMPLLIVLGFGLRYMLEFNKTSPYRRTLSTTLIIILISVLGIKYAAIGAYYVTSKRESGSSFDIKRSIVHTLQREFGWSTQEIDYNVGLWIESDGVDTRGFQAKRRLTQGIDENSGISYLARTEKVQTLVSENNKYEGCALIVMPDRIGEKSPVISEEEIQSHMPFVRNVIIDRVINTNNLQVIGYRTDNQNCFRSYGNRYIYSPEENLAAASAGNLASLKAIDISTQSQRRIAAKIPGNSSILVELAKKSDGATITIHGNALRGLARSAKTLRAVFEDYSTHFIPVDGGEVISSYSDRPIGKRGWYTPWTIPIPSLPPGRYQMILNINKLSILDFKTLQPISSGPHIITLAETINWK